MEQTFTVRDSSFLAHSFDWDFRDADTKEGTHVIHSYPAMMIPQVARHLIAWLRQLHPEAQTLLDPFCGAGTVLVEAARQRLEAWGNDLNPLAVRIARARTTPIDDDPLLSQLSALDNRLTPLALATWEGPIPTFPGQDFWFKPTVVRALAFVAANIGEIAHANVRNLAWMAFSETVRWVSNTRNSEFKLYRLAPHKLAAWNPDVLAVFRETLARYAEGVRAFSPELRQAPIAPRIVSSDACELSGVPDGYFDLMVTSPPYGDSRTTVAYGQFSRLSLEWLGVPSTEARAIDRRLLGGKASSTPANALPSPTLQAALAEIAHQDGRRAREVETFYQDVDRAIAAITRKLKPGALCGWVVANRTVKRVVLPTDQIIAELSSARHYTVVDNLVRNIPNKRMPLANSPSNVVGDTGATMTKEHLLILRYHGGP
ncbi:MAG: DNA adenine methylase [Firmicutes bacterium]|nr:DNA adenine methylase [Bacillota bacterium]